MPVSRPPHNGSRLERSVDASWVCETHRIYSVWRVSRTLHDVAEAPSTDVDTMRWTREQYIELMTFGDAPRPMFSELFGPLIGLDDQWRAQGASEDEINMIGFDWDFAPYVECGGVTGVFGAPPSELAPPRRPTLRQWRVRILLTAQRSFHG